jgi:hypothetical protein
VVALFAIGFSASDEDQQESPSTSKSETKEVANKPTASVEKEVVEEKAVSPSPKAVSQIKDIEELRQAINNTVWTHTARGDAWLRYEFVGNTVKQYGALPQSGKWRYDGESQFELSEKRSESDGKRYFEATFMPKTESLAMFELPVTFNFRDYHLYLNGQDMGGFIMADYEWD